MADSRNVAMDIEQLLIWTYQDQAADAVVGRAAGTSIPMIGGTSNSAMIASHMALGCRVDVPGGGARWAAGIACDIHPDAEALHDAVKELPSQWIGMVIRHAKAGTRPDWLPGAVPKVVQWRYDRDHKKRRFEFDGKRHKFYCYFHYDPMPEYIAYMRRVYVEWWQALWVLYAHHARGELPLAKHKILRPVAPRRPWLAKSG